MRIPLYCGDTSETVHGEIEAVNLARRIHRSSMSFSRRVADDRSSR